MHSNVLVSHNKYIKHINIVHFTILLIIWSENILI